MFGFGKGKILMTLDKQSFSPGETIKGNLTLELKKTVSARQLRVIFLGTMEIRRPYKEVVHSTSRSTLTRQRTERERKEIFRKEVRLDGDKDYNGGQYSFEIKVPKNILTRAGMASGELGAALEAFKSMSGVQQTVSWIVQANLEVPRGIDVNAKQNINIG